MTPPKCRTCQRQEWGHVCRGKPEPKKPRAAELRALIAAQRDEQRADRKNSIARKPPKFRTKRKDRGKA